MATAGRRSSTTSAPCASRLRSSGRRCAHIELPGGTRTRVWVDPQSGEVLRLDERLMGQVEIPVPRAQQRLGAARFMNIERVDMSIRYAPVAFQDPDERLLCRRASKRWS